MSCPVRGNGEGLSQTLAKDGGSVFFPPYVTDLRAEYLMKTVFTKTNESWLTHLGRASSYSRDGLLAAFREEIAFRLVVFESVVLGFLSFLLARSWSEVVLLILPSCLCLLVELLNSALENTVDFISCERHPLAKKAKDMGSAAQFCAQCFLCLVWLSYLFFS